MRLALFPADRAIPEHAAEVGLERPGAQVAGGVEERVDVAQPGGGRPFNSHRFGQERRVPLGSAAIQLAAMQLDLVEQLRAVAAQHQQPHRAGVPDHGAGVVNPERRLQPRRRRHQVLEEEGEALGHRVVAQIARLHRELARHARVVVRVARLVHEHLVVVAPADECHHEVDLVRHLHGGAEGPWGLVRALLEIQAHAASVQAQPFEGELVRRQEPLAGESPVEPGSAHECRDVRSAQPLQPERELAPQLGREDVLVPGVGRGQECVALLRQAAQVQPAHVLAHGERARPPELPHERVGAPVLLDVERVEIGIDHAEPGLLQPRPAVRIELVGLLDGRAPERDLGAIDLDRPRRLEPRYLGSLGLGRLTDVALHGEAHELARSRFPKLLDDLAREEVRVPLVDRLDFEARLAAREVEDVLALDRTDELLDPGAIGVHVHRLPA